MQVFVQRATGAVEVVCAQTGAELLAQGLHLTMNGRIVTPETVLEKDAYVTEMVDADGAGKKRKKKVYTKPKKIAHKHKPVKLATLKFYKVDGNDKVTRLRKECMSCGAGVFMAQHKNRFTCGKCSVTALVDGKK